MARQFVPYTIDSFTGGITDKVVKPSNPVQYETLKNLIPQRDESLRQRDGFKLWDNTVEDLDILQMFEFQGFVFYYCSDKKFYYIANSGVGTPAVVKTISNATTYEATAYDGFWHISESNGELTLSHEPLNKYPTPYVAPRTALRRIYIDENGIPRICTSQLPRVLENGVNALVECIAGNAYTMDFVIYWKYSYQVLVDKEVFEKIVYGEPSDISVNIGSSILFTINWNPFDNSNLNGIVVVDDNFSDNEMWDITKIELVVGIRFTDISLGIVDSQYFLSTDTEFLEVNPDQGTIDWTDGDKPIKDLINSLYFEDGTLDQQSLINGSYFNTTVDGTSYYGNTGAAPNRVYPSIEDAPYWTNLLSFIELPKPLTGLDNFSTKAIAFSNDGTYRLEGQKFQDNSGSLYYRTISDRYGCIAGNSIVQTQYGLFFWSKSGIFICDGTKVNRISDSLQARYKSWVTTDTQKNAIKGWYDDEEDKVYWVVQESDGHTFLLVLDLYFGISSESVFYVIDSDHSYWNITDGMLNSYDNKILIAGNEFVYQPDPSYTYDALSSYVSSEVAGLNVPIKYDYKSPVITYNDKLGRKWTSHIVLNMKDSDSAAGVSTRIRSYADLSANPHYLDPCFYYQKMYSDDQEWGNIDPVWGESERPIFKRYFDQSTVRNTFIQIGFDNLKIVRYTDADYEKATYTQTSSLRYLLLETTSFDNSPITANEALDGSWYIKLEEDDYETEYPITSIQNAGPESLILFLPPNTELTSGELTQSNHGWKLCQISKEHRFHLLSYSLLYTPMGHRTIPGYQPEKMNGA